MHFVWTKSDESTGDSRPIWMYSKLSGWKLCKWNDVYAVSLWNITGRFSECYRVRVPTWTIFERRDLYFSMPAWNVRRRCNKIMYRVPRHTNITSWYRWNHWVYMS